MDAFHTPDGRRVPAVTAERMRELDRVAVEETGPELLQMMENAGRSLAEHALRVADDRPVTVFAGGGANGGGGLCAARHVHNRGGDRAVRAVLDRPPADLEGAAATQRRILDATTVPVAGPPDDPGTVDGLGEGLVVDAVIGYGLDSAPHSAARDLIRATGRADRVLSLDVPSGVDATTGDRPGDAVDPDRTLTLALPKTGLVPEGLFLADVGIPPAAFERAGVDYDPPFGDRWWVELER
jgi:NAD(P)H-hydrate epimerase